MRQLYIFGDKTTEYIGPVNSPFKKLPDVSYKDLEETVGLQKAVIKQPVKYPIELNGYPYKT